MISSRLTLPLLTFMYFCVLSVHNLQYSEMEVLGVSCPIRDSCMSNQNTTFEQRNCECDRLCSNYGDCCIDASRASSRIRASQMQPKCMAFGGEINIGVYVVSKCSRDYTGSREVVRHCEGPSNMSDPLFAAPATDAANRVTYRNRYCAECNHAVSSQLTSWLIQVKCDTLKAAHNVSSDYIWNNMQYSDQSDQWGVTYRNDTEEYFPCELDFYLPTQLQHNVRFCRANVVSTCHRSWRRVSVKTKCQSYLAVVAYGDVVYRNPHCAVCNDVGPSNLKCDIGILSRKQPMSFALLLDVNRRDGDVVGMTKEATPSCGTNKKYDPFAKRCRNLVCALPGYKMVNERCVRS